MKVGEIIKGEDLLGKTLEVCEGGMLKVVEDEFPQVGDDVWYVGEFGYVGCFKWQGEGADLFLAKYNRIFQTKELALEYSDYLKKKAELSFEPDWGDFEQMKYFFYYDYEMMHFVIRVTVNEHEGQQSYFPNRDCMDKLVVSIGEEKFLYFEFGIPMEGE